MNIFHWKIDVFLFRPSILTVAKLSFTGEGGNFHQNDNVLTLHLRSTYWKVKTDNNKYMILDGE